MPDIKKFSTGRLGNHWPFHENTDHTNTRGLDNDGTVGIEAYIDEDIVRAYDDNRPIKSLLSNEEMNSGAIDCVARGNNVNAIMKNLNTDWSMSVGEFGMYVDPRDFTKRVDVTPLELKVCSAYTPEGGLTFGSSKKIAGFERDDGSKLWVDEHDWNYSNQVTLDDPDAAYNGYYRPIYTDAAKSAFPENYEDYQITVRQRYTTGNVFTFPIYSDREFIVPYSTSVFNIENEPANFYQVEYPGYDLYPETYVRFESKGLGTLEIGEDAQIIKNIKREEHKLLASEFNAEAGVYKAELKSDVFRNNKSNNVSKIENEVNFLRAFGGVDQYNTYSRVYLKQHRSQTGTLTPLEDSKNFLGNTKYSFGVKLGDTEGIIEIQSPETRGYQDIILNVANPNDTVATGVHTYNFYILVNDEATPTLVNFDTDDSNLYELRDSINSSFDSNSVYAESKIHESAGQYNLRVYSRSSGDFSYVEITAGTSDLVSNIGGSYGSSFSGQEKWYIYYNPSHTTPENPDPDDYIARRDGGSTTVNDFNTGHLNIGNQLFNAMVAAGFDDFEVGLSTHIEDVHSCQLYISDLNNTQGYIDLNMSVPVPSADSGLEELKTYYFQLDIDGSGFQEYSFTTTTDTSYTGVINSINNVLRGIAQFSILPSSEVRITSDKYGPKSYIKTADGFSGDSLFGAAYPAAGFTPSSLHALHQYGTGRDITIYPRQRNTFAIFTDSIAKRAVYSHDDSVLRVTPNTETDIRDHVDTYHAYKSRDVHGNPYERWSTHNDRVVQIDISSISGWSSGAIITKLETLNIDGTDYLFIGNSDGQIYFIDNNYDLYDEFLLSSYFTRFTDSSVSGVSGEKINDFFKYIDGINSKEYLFIASDTHILYADCTSGITTNTSFIDIDTSSSLSVPNVSSPIFSEIRDSEDWIASVSSSVSNRYIVFVGKSDDTSQWEHAPILYALHDTSASTIDNIFDWYAEERYDKRQIDDITSVTKYSGWQDPEQDDQLFIAVNVNGPEIWTGNSQNNDVDIGAIGDDRFNRFSWIESNADRGTDVFGIDDSIERINNLVVYDDRIFVSSKRKDSDTLGGLFSYGFNKLQDYFKLDSYDSYYDADEEALYLLTSEGAIGNADPSILKISEEVSDGRAQIFSIGPLNTVTNWPSDSAFRIKLNGFIVGGVNFDGEYNVQFDGQGKNNLQELVDAINGLYGDGLSDAIDTETGIGGNNLTTVLRARALTQYTKQGNTYTPEYKIVIESKIGSDQASAHSTTSETTQSNCWIQINHPTVGTTIVGTGNDTMEIVSGTTGYADLQLVDWDDGEVYRLKRVGTESVSFSGNTYVDISSYVDTDYSVHAGSLRVKTNENDELGFIQGLGAILKTNTLTGLNNDSTRYGLKVTFNENVAPAGQEEITEIATPADVGGSLGGTYWNVSASITTSPWTEYYVWYNVDRLSADPVPGGRRGIEVVIDRDSTAEEVAEATKNALDASPDFSATRSSDTVTVISGVGDLTDATDVDAGVTINVTQQGSDPSYFVEWVDLTGSNVQTYWDLVNEIDSQLTNGTAALQTIASTTEYCDIVITSNLVGDNSFVRIENTGLEEFVELLGNNGIDVIPNRSIQGSTALNTSGSQTFGITWENADYFYIEEHPDNGQSRIYIPNGDTRIDPGATVWLNFWEWKKLTKIPAKDINDENNIPSTEEWTYDLEQKKIVVGEEPSKTFPQDVLYVDAKIEKVLKTLDLTDTVPSTQEDLSDAFHLTQPQNIENSEVTLARPLSRVSALHYGVKLWSSDTEDPTSSNYSFFLPRLDAIRVGKEDDYHGERVRLTKGSPDPNLPHVELDLTNQEKESFVYTTYIDSSDYNENNITMIPWYNSHKLDEGRIYLNGHTQYFNTNTELISKRGIKPTNDSTKIGKRPVDNTYSLVRTTDPIDERKSRRRVNSSVDVDYSRAIFLDINQGNDANSGYNPDSAVSTISQALSNTTNNRNTIVIMEPRNSTRVTIPHITINRSYLVKIVAEGIVRSEGITANSEVYIEGLDLSGTVGGSPVSVVVTPNGKLTAKYCRFNSIQTETTGNYTEGLNIHVYNSTFEDTGLHIEDFGSSLDFSGSIDVEFDHVYFKKAEIVYFHPNSYNDSVENNFVFNNVTNGLGQPGYIIDTPESTLLNFEFNRSLLVSGNTTDFASAASVLVNESITYTTTNNETYGTGSILSNNTNVVNPGDADIVPETGAPVSKARGFGEDSVAIKYVDAMYDVGAYNEIRFPSELIENEKLPEDRSTMIFEGKRVQYRYSLNPEKISLYIRFKPLGGFQEQGVLFDSRYDGDYNSDTSTFGVNGIDFIQLVYDNKTYDRNYLSDQQYTFKVIISNGQTVNVAVIGPRYDINNYEEYNNWHEIGVLITNSEVHNPKYDDSDLTTDVNRGRRQTLVYTVFDRQIDRIYGLKNPPYTDDGGDEVVGSTWKPGETLTDYFNIGGGWTADWIDTASGKAWSTWATSTYRMLVDEYLVSSDLIPLNIIKDLGEKEIIDLEENEYKTPNLDNKNTILLSHGDNSHPFSENGIEPFDDYYVSFRPYEGYENHAISIERASDNLLPQGRMSPSKWFDRSRHYELKENVTIVNTFIGDNDREFGVIYNDSGNLYVDFIDYYYRTINYSQQILSSEASEVEIVQTNTKHVIVLISSTDSKIYRINIERNDHTNISSATILNNNTSEYLSASRSHDEDILAITYRESNIGYLQRRRISDGTAVGPRVEFADSQDVTYSRVIESLDENYNKCNAIFYAEEPSKDLKFVKYSEDLNSILLSNELIVSGQVPAEIEATQLGNDNTVLKWKDVNTGGDSNVYFTIFSKSAEVIVSHTEVFSDSSDLIDTTDLKLLKNSDLLFSSVVKSSGEIQFKMYSQYGEELDISPSLRNYTEMSVDSYKLSSVHEVDDLVILSTSGTTINEIILQTNIPSKWYRDTYGVYDHYIVEVRPTRTAFGQAMRMLFNHTGTTGETGIFVADAETNDLSQFTTDNQTHGSISTEEIAKMHANYGYQFDFDGSGSQLYLEESGWTPVADSYSRFYIRLNKYFGLTGSGTRRMEVARFGSSADPVILNIEFSDPATGGDGNFKLVAETTSFGGDITSSSIIGYSYPHYIDTRWHQDATGGWQVWVDGNLIFDYTGQDTSGLTGADYISIGSTIDTSTPPTSQSLIFYDDIIVDSTYIGEYTAGIGQGILWSTANVSYDGEQHFLSGYYYAISGDWELVLDGPSLNSDTKITFSENGEYSHDTKGVDTVNYIELHPINWNGVYRFEIGLIPDNTGPINIHLQSTRNAEDERIDEFLVDNLKLERNEHPSSIDSAADGYICYPVSLKDRGNAFFRIRPQFFHDTTTSKTIFSATSFKEDGTYYITHDLTYDPVDNRFELYLADADGNSVELASDTFGTGQVTREKTDLNEHHNIAANWNTIDGTYELYLDDKFYKLTSQPLPNFKRSALTFIGNRETRDSAADSLFDIFRLSDEPLSRRNIERASGKIDPFLHENKTNIGHVTVKALSFYGIHESDEATIYAEKDQNKSSLVLEVGNNFEDEIVLRHLGTDLVTVGAGGLVVDGTITAKTMQIQATTTIASYDDHVTVRYGFIGTPPEYNDGYFEVERGSLTNSEIRFDESQDAWIFHDGTNRRISIDGTHIGTWKAADDFNLVSNSTGAIRLSTNSSTDTGLGDGTFNRTDGTERVKVTPTETVINDPGIDHDFRVESVTGQTTRVRDATHLLFADATEKQIRIGRDTAPNNSDGTTTGTLVVNYKTTQQSQNTTSFGTTEFRNDVGLRSGYIGAGNGSDIWEIVSEIQTLQLDAIDFDIILSGTASDSFNLNTAGGMLFDVDGADDTVEWDIESTNEESWLAHTRGGVKWFLDGPADSSRYRIFITSPHNDSYYLQTAGGVRFDVNGTTTTSGSEDKFKVETANTIQKSFHVDSSGGAWFDVNNGFYVHEDTANAYFRMTDLGRFEVYTEDTDASSVDTYTDGGYTIHTGGQFYSMSLTGFRFEEDSGTYLESTTTGEATLHAVNGLNLTENSGSSIVIANDGRIDATGLSGNNVALRVDGKIDITSANNTGSNINITAQSDGNVIIVAQDDNINQVSSTNEIDTDNLYINTQDGAIRLIDANSSRVRLYHDNSVKLVTHSTGINIEGHINSADSVVYSDTSTGSQVQTDGRLIYDNSTNAGFYVYNATASRWVQLWDDFNQGHTSGMNADTVDGVHASQFIRDDVNDDVNAHTTWNDGYRIRFGNDHDMSIFHSGGTNYIDVVNSTNLVIQQGGSSSLEVRSDGTVRAYNQMTIGNVSSSGESTIQSTSTDFAGDGSLQTPWIYTAGIEATNERDSASTGVLLGAGTGFTNTDEVSIITNGANRFKVNADGTSDFYDNSIRFDSSANRTIFGIADASSHTGTNTVEGIGIQGSLAAYKLYNAVWNDYAESFEYDKTSGTPEPGYVYVQTGSGLKKANKRAHKSTIGIYSNTYGMLMGSKGTHGESEEWNKIPIGLAGVVWSWTKSKINIGDLLVSDKDGTVTKANIIDRIFRSDRIIGKALDISKDKIIKKIRILVK